MQHTNILDFFKVIDRFCNWVHLTRCLRVLRDAAASQLNKHLSTNSDTCARARARTADNCGVGDVAAARHVPVVLMVRAANAFYENN